MLIIERRSTAELAAGEVRQLRGLLAAAFLDEEAFSEDDWQHALGGTHLLGRLEGEIVAHAAVVRRVLEADGRPIEAGYVEAVAVAPELQGRGHGTTLMRAVGELIATEYQLGALGTGVQPFYERIGWQRWLGPTSVRTAAGPQRTPDEDGGILILRTPTTPPLDLTALLSCEWRPGDAW